MSDLGTWIIEAPDGSIHIQGNRVSWVHADRSMVRCIAKEKKVQVDFSQSFAVCIDEGYVEDEKNRGLIRLWELRNDWDNRVWVYARKARTGWTIHFEQRSAGRDLWGYHGTSVFTWSQRFRVELMRLGDSYQLRVSDESKFLEDSGWINGFSEDYGWIWLASTIKSRRNNGNWSTGYIEDFTNQLIV